MKCISLLGSVYPDFLYCKMNDVCKHNQLYLLECIAGMMRLKYCINITVHFLYFHLTIISLQVLCANTIKKYALSLHYVPLIIYFIVLKMNSIQSNEYTSF